MNRLLIAPRKRMREALRHPRYALRQIVREVAHADERFLASLAVGESREIRDFIQEPFTSRGFFEHMSASMDPSQIGTWANPFYAKKSLLPYALVRAIRPDLVVETGVSHGVSSAMILFALHRNGSGRLHSIDLGQSDVPGKSVGWLVPDWLRESWELHIGDSLEVLPHLLDKVGTIDLFVHDSLHTYDHMMFEFRAAYPHVRDGGFILADDALWNTAFDDFVKQVSPAESGIIHGVGMLRKAE